MLPPFNDVIVEVNGELVSSLSLATLKVTCLLHEIGISHLCVVESVDIRSIRLIYGRFG